MNEFENYRLEAWLEGGVVVVVLPTTDDSTLVLRSRRSERWPAIALSAVLAFSTALGSNAIALDHHPLHAAAVRKVALGKSGEASYMTPTGRFEVSPQYWSALIAKMRTWRPVAPDDGRPYPEPFI